MPTVTRSLGEGTQSVLLTVAILEEIAEGRGTIGISSLAKKLDTSKSRVFRHVQTLVACDFLTRSATGDHYSAGLALIALSRAIHDRHDIVATARPIMDALHARLGHTVILSRIGRDGVHVLQSVSRGQPIVLEIPVGSVLPFETSAQGLIAMSRFDPAQARKEDALAKAVKAHGERLADELEAIRDRGWSVAQMRAGLLGLAAPVLDASGSIVATLALLDTAVAMERSIEAGAPDLLKEAAETLARSVRAQAEEPA